MGQRQGCLNLYKKKAENLRYKKRLPFQAAVQWWKEQTEPLRERPKAYTEGKFSMQEIFDF